MRVVEFGRALIERKDLDPLYVMLNGAGLDGGTVRRFSLAYWMFYHAGVAALIAEAGSNGFWESVWTAQEEKWPRGTERRHFKGEQSRRAIAELERQYPHPEDAPVWAATALHESELTKHLAGSWRRSVPAHDFELLRARVMCWRGFGPWIAFKVADMADAVLGIPVDFGSAMPYLFDDPVKGAVYVAAQNLGHDDPDNVEGLKAFYAGHGPAERRAMVEPVMEYLQQELGHLQAPHANRRLRLQEYETILCKYKSHLHGKYPVGKDTTEILHVLGEGWGDLADHLRATLRRVTS